MPLRRLPTWPAGVARRSEESANTSRRAIAALPPHLAIRELPSTGRSIGRPRAVVPQSLARRGVSTIEIAGRASRASARSRPARNSRTHARSSLLRQGMYEQRPPSQRARIVSPRPSNQPPIATATARMRHASLCKTGRLTASAANQTAHHAPSVLTALRCDATRPTETFHCSRRAALPAVPSPLPPFLAVTACP